jgi:hypothetical protein
MWTLIARTDVTTDSSCHSRDVAGVKRIRLYKRVSINIRYCPYCAQSALLREDIMRATTNVPHSAPSSLSHGSQSEFILAPIVFPLQPFPLGCQ